MGDRDRVDYLFEPSGSELHWDGLKDKVQAQSGPTASLSGPAPKYSQPLAVRRHPDDRSGLAGTRPSDGGQPKQLTPEQMLAQASAMLEAQKVQTGAQMGSGPSVGSRDDAGGRMPDWLAAAGGTDVERAQAYAPQQGAKLNDEQVEEFLRTYKGPGGP